MSNYLAGLATTAAINTVNRVVPQVTPLIGAVRSDGISTGALSAMAFGLMAPGSKPKALHTEFASGEANWQKPYGANTDIVFYLNRAGSTLTSGTRDIANDLTEQGVFGAETQTGPDVAGDVQTPLSQVAVGATTSKRTGFGPSGGLAGPLTGFDIDAETPLGSTNQSISAIQSTAASVQNVTKSVQSLQSPRLGLVPSVRYFHDTVTKAFYPDAPLSGKNRSAAEILATTSFGVVSKIATETAIASGGVTTSKQLVKGINEGTIGYTTRRSENEAERLGPKGMPGGQLLR